MLGWLFAALLALLAMFYFLSGDSSLFADIEAGQWAMIAAGSTLVILYILGIAGEGQTRASQALKYAGIWLLAGLSLVALYAYRDQMPEFVTRIAGELAPPGQAITVESGPQGEVSVRIRRRGDGHFSARADINGVTSNLMVDTGASTVVLKPADAERAGVDIANLNYNVAVETANGTTYAAPVKLRTITIGPIELRDVEALVAKPGNIKENLLGMSFLRRLRSYEFSGEFLTLRG
jgi:aspartyl protease family protein